MRLVKKVGWISQVPKTVTEILNGVTYTETLNQAYELTYKGLGALRRMKGESRHSKIPYKVFWEMLSSKPADRDYIRNRRTDIIDCIKNTYKSPNEILSMLERKD